MAPLTSYTNFAEILPEPLMLFFTARIESVARNAVLKPS